MRSAYRYTIHQLIDVLQQGRALLLQIDDAIYTRAVPPIFPYGIGSHLRHCLDFFTCFLDGLESGTIDYDRRERDKAAERHRLVAVERIAALIERLQALLVEDADDEVKAAEPLRIKLEGGVTEDRRREDGQSAGPSSEEATGAVSSLLRELQFLLSHTIHHYALIAILLRLQGIEPGPEFGVAPSTLQHRQAA